MITANIDIKKSNLFSAKVFEFILC